ncbi:hypothetical protein CKA38_12655 [Ereboglobus luteus]|uniref:Uncharacterized protein n=1 Tax=Ereboglobus luteus TaxID=1796921 RepID=A0A2U8E574_9BACT|nr:hypothetical protein CKA38_12655 [Ereboglobus luteus]
MQQGKELEHMNDNLDQLSGTQTSETFAVKVAGWARFGGKPSLQTSASPKWSTIINTITLGCGKLSVGTFLRCLEIRSSFFFGFFSALLNEFNILSHGAAFFNKNPTASCLDYYTVGLEKRPSFTDSNRGDNKVSWFNPEGWIPQTAECKIVISSYLFVARSYKKLCNSYRVIIEVCDCDLDRFRIIATTILGGDFRFDANAGSSTTIGKKAENSTGNGDDKGNKGDDVVMAH